MIVCGRACWPLTASANEGPRRSGSAGRSRSRCSQSNSSRRIGARSHCAAARTQQVLGLLGGLREEPVRDLPVADPAAHARARPWDRGRLRGLRDRLEQLGALMSHLREVRDEGHRALVFSQFTELSGCGCDRTRGQRHSSRSPSRVHEGSDEGHRSLRRGQRPRVPHQSQGGGFDDLYLQAHSGRPVVEADGCAVPTVNPTNRIHPADPQVTVHRLVASKRSRGAGAARRRPTCSPRSWDQGMVPAR